MHFTANGRVADPIPCYLTIVHGSAHERLGPRDTSLALRRSGAALDRLADRPGTPLEDVRIAHSARCIGYGALTILRGNTVRAF